MIKIRFYRILYFSVLIFAMFSMPVFSQTHENSPPESNQIPAIRTPAETTPVPSPSPRPHVRNTISESRGGSEISLDGHPLFRIYADIGSFSHLERGKIVNKRIRAFADDFQMNVQTLKVKHSNTISEIYYGNNNVVSLTEKDARPLNLELKELAEGYRRTIQYGVEEYREKIRFKRIVFSALSAIVGIIILIILAILTGRGVNFLKERLESARGSLIRSVRFQNLEILSENHIIGSLTLLLRAIRTIILLLTFSLLFHFSFTLLPGSDQYADSSSQLMAGLLKWLGEGLLKYIPRFIFIILVGLLTWYALKFVNFIFEAIETGNVTVPGFYPEWISPTKKIVRFGVYAFAFAVILPYLPGYESAAFKGVSIFMGVVFSLGSTTLVSNIIAGIVLTYTRAFKDGDRVKIADYQGDIVERTLLVTRIKTIKNEEISIPNSMVISSAIKNYSQGAENEGLILHTSITIGYDVPWRKVHQLLIDSALSTSGILEEPRPFVLQTALNDYNVAYEINAYTHYSKGMAGMYSDLHQNIQDRFNEAGVEIMSPSYYSLRDGNDVTIPEKYRSITYRSGHFRIGQ